LVSSQIATRRGSVKGKEKEIIATLDLPIRHCLVVLKGTKMEDITMVKSHEQASPFLLLTLIEADSQALGQSSKFLSRHLPNAKRIPTDSTAAAAKSLLPTNQPNGGVGRGEGVCAAICSESVVEIYPELEVLYKGTQDRSGKLLLLILFLRGIADDADNFTRFILLKTAYQDQAGSDLVPKPTQIPSSTSTSDSMSSFYLLDSPSLINQLPCTSPTTIGSLHSRPIIPISSDKRVYPQGAFVELRSESNTPRRKAIGDGILYLGSGPVVFLEPI
jgi:prephenate dehydratase